MKVTRYAILLLLLIALSSAALADTISGTVKNGTTGKLASGVEMVLMNLSQGGMDEGGRTQTDAQGRFSFSVAGPAQPHLVRAIYQGVTYHKQLPPGTNTADIEVFEATRKTAGLGASVQVMRVQATRDTLQVVELYAVKNDTEPKRTINADQTFSITLPEGAQIDESVAQAPGGMPIQAAAVPDGKQKGRYYYVFPLRPGETRFQLAYHLPYSGSATLQVKPPQALEHFVVLTPKAMTFTPTDAARFQAMGEEDGAITQVATSVKAGETLAFKVAGTGEFPREQQGGDEQAAAASGGGAGDDNRPGGGLGLPSDAPDPLRQYRWYILGAIALGLGATAFFALRRPLAPAAPVVSPAARAPQTRPAEARVRTAPLSAGGNGGATQTLLMAALKEELFQLEVDRQQERISSEDYQKAKAALDVVIARAVQRGKPAAAKV